MCVNSGCACIYLVFVCVCVSASIYACVEIKVEAGEIDVEGSDDGVARGRYRRKEKNRGSRMVNGELKVRLGSVCSFGVAAAYELSLGFELLSMSMRTYSCRRWCVFKGNVVVLAWLI